AGAVRLSRALRTDPALTRLLFAAWADADIDAATAELASFSPGEAREIALALLRSIGNDEARASRLAQYLPPAERAAFLADAIAARGEASPLAALRQALALEDSGARSLALTRLAHIW